MLDVTEKPLSREELTAEQPESADPAYLAWKRNKIQATLDNDAPEKRRPVEAVFSDLYRRLDQ